MAMLVITRWYSSRTFLASDVTSARLVARDPCGGWLCDQFLYPGWPCRGRHGRGAKELCIDWEFYGYIMTSIEQFLYITFWRTMVEGRKNGLGVWE